MRLSFDESLTVLDWLENPTPEVEAIMEDFGWVENGALTETGRMAVAYVEACN